MHKLTAHVATAIAALVSDAPDALNTLGEISNSLNDNDSAYATLLALIQAKNPLLTFPSSATSTNLLSGTTLRALQATGIAQLVESSDRVLLTVNGVSSEAFSAYNTHVAGLLLGKQDNLTSDTSTGQAILDNDIVKRIRFHGNGVNSTSDANEVLVQMTGYSASQVDALVALRQLALSNATGSDTELLNGTVLRRLAATSTISLSVDSDVVTIASDAPSLADTAAAIASALTSYATTSSLTTLLAGKQATLTSASGSGTTILDGTTVRRLNTAGNESVVAMTESGGVITLTIDGYTKAQVDGFISSVSASLTDANVTGTPLRTSGSELKRLHVAGPLSLTEATAGQLLLTNTAYTQSATDSLLLAKQPALTVSGVTGSSLLNGQILKRLDFHSVFSVSDSGHALNISASGLQESLINSTGAGEGERIDLWNSGAKWVRCLEFFPSNVFSTATGSDNINVTSDTSSFVSTTSLTTGLAGKQKSLQWLAATGTPFSDESTLNVLKLTASAPLSVNLQQANRSMLLSADCYSKSDGNVRYWRKTEDLLQVDHPSATRYLRISANHSSNVQMRYRGGSFLIRRVNSSDASSTVLSLSGSNQNCTCSGNLIANNFNSSSDTKLKDHQQVAPTADAAAIMAAVDVKTYSRNDLDGQQRVGFIAQDLQEACDGHWTHIVSSSPDVDEEGVETGTSTLQVDYSRLVTVLWSVVKDLTARVATLEAQR